MGISTNDVYFASYEQGDPRLLDALIDKVKIYRQFCKTTGKVSKWQRSLQNYYGVSSDGTKSSNMVTRGGDQGQLLMAKVNDYRNLIQHQLILITSQRPAGQAKAINSDTKSLHQARIGSLLTEYYLSQVGWEQKFTRAAEIALVADESFMALDWDATTGDPIRPDMDGKMQMSGDSTLRVISPWNMCRDPYLSNADDMQWGIYSYRQNKFDLAAKYPNEEHSIINGNNKGIEGYVFDSFTEKDTDQTIVYCLSHNPSPACPQGRLTIFTPEVILLDTPAFPYSEWNIYRMNQNDVIETPFGYSNNSDILAIEEVTDALHSVCMTNQTAFGAQAIIGPKGSGLTHEALAMGLAYFEVEAQFVDKIRPLALTKTAPEIFEYINRLDTKKETIAGINSVVRGDPDGALRSNSGSALALVQAQSLQFNSGGQRSYYHILSKVNTGHIKLLQRYAMSKRVARITGKVQGQYLKEFYYEGKDLQNVSSVVFESVDPAFQSIGGKVAAADNLLQKGLIKNAKQYLTVMRTGSLDALTEDDEDLQVAQKSENERLREGQKVQVVSIENHEEHIKTHAAVIASPESKEDPMLVQTVLEHIQEHTDTWNHLSQTNPALLIATGQKVLPPPPGAGGPGPGPGGPGGPPGQPPSSGPVPPHPGGGGGHLVAAHPPGSAGPATPKLLGDQPPVQTQAGMVRQPNMPVNPATGQRAPMPGP